MNVEYCISMCVHIRGLFFLPHVPAGTTQNENEEFWAELRGYIHAAQTFGPTDFVLVMLHLKKVKLPL
jgi:hypothetical protein